MLLTLSSSLSLADPSDRSNWKNRADASGAWTTLRTGDWQLVEVAGSRYQEKYAYGAGLRYERRSYQSLALQDLGFFIPGSIALNERLRLSGQLLGTVESDFSPHAMVSSSLDYAGEQFGGGLSARYGRWPSGWAAGLVPALQYQEGQWRGVARLISTIPEIGPISLTPELELAWRSSYWWRYAVRSHYGYEPLNDRLVPPQLLSRQLGLSLWLSRRLSDWDGLQLILASVIFLERRELPFNADRHRIALHYFYTF